MSTSGPQSLWDHQQTGIIKLSAAIQAGSRSPCMVANTGAGKTVVAAEIVARAAEKGERALLLTHRRILLAQTQKCFRQEVWTMAYLQPDIVAMRRREFSLARYRLLLLDFSAKQQISRTSISCSLMRLTQTLRRTLVRSSRRTRNVATWSSE